jgi:hypothetical protein
MKALAELRQKAVAAGSSWILERIYGIGISELFLYLRGVVFRGSNKRVSHDINVVFLEK